MRTKFTGFVGLLSVLCWAPTALAATPPTKTAGFGLPWAAGTTAVLDAGPHTNNVHQCLSGEACNALDFTPATGLVTAAGPGVVQSVPSPCAPGLVVIRQKTGSSFNGWWTGYYHLAGIRVHPGEGVNTGTVIASLAQNLAQATPCGGSWSGPHVHFFVKYSTSSSIGDPFQNTGPDVDLQNIVIGGWKVTKEGYSSDDPQGCMTYLSTGQKVCSPSGVVKNYAPGAVNPLANGMFVKLANNASVYEIVGGAPLYVSNWSVFGGGQPTNTITQQQFDSLSAVPANGTIVNAVTAAGKEYGSFVIAGGAPLWISNWSAVGGEPANLPRIDAWDVENAGSVPAHLNVRPSNGTAINATTTAGKEYGSFMVAGGAPLYISSWSAVGGEPKGLVRVDAYDVLNPSNPASHLNEFPVNGTIVNAVTSAGKEYGAFVIAGGAPLYISNWKTVGGEPDPLIRIDAWDIQHLGSAPSHLIPLPANGTFLQTEAGAVYRVAGGTAISSNGWSVFGGVQPHVIFDPWDLTNFTNPLDHLLAAPVNYTVVEGLPSHAYWAFASGKRSSTAANPAAVAVADSGLLAFPLAGSTSPPPPPPPPVRCIVPHLHHKTVKQAKRMLRRAHCKLGRVKVSGHRHRHHHVPRVARQSVKAGSSHRRGYKVGITLH